MTPPPTANSILIIRPSALGDVCRSVPVLVSLRRAYPHALIDWLVQDSFIPAIAAHPDLSNALPFPRKDFGRWVARANLPALRAYLRSLRDRRYDLVIDAQGLARSGLLAWATRAKARVGYSNARELGWLAMTRRVESSIETHTVDRMLTLVAALGLPAFADPQAMRLYTTPADRAFVDAAGLPGVVVLAPTSRWPGKQWPADRFAHLARALLDAGHRVVVVGGANEREQIGPLLHLCRAEAASGRITDLVGKTTIGQLMALIERASLVVANDSAALHMGVGFDRPIVALFGPTRVHRVGPYRRDNDVLQVLRPGDRMDHKDESNGRAMMERIQTNAVVVACLQRLAP